MIAYQLKTKPVLFKLRAHQNLHTKKVVSCKQHFKHSKEL